MKNKNAEISNSIIIQIIMVVLITALFISANVSKVNTRGIRQDIIESQIAMFIEAAESGMSFSIFKLNSNGIIDDVRIEDGKVFVSVDGFKSSKGKIFFTSHVVKVEDVGDKFRISVS